MAGALAFAAVAAIQSARSQTVETSPHAEDKAIAWRSDLASTLAEAGKQDKLVLLRFSAEWCAPCRVMDARVWSDVAVQAKLAENYLPVKADVDDEASVSIARRYGVQAVPTLLILDTNGHELARGGFMSSPKMIKFLDSSTTGTAAD